VQEQTAWTGQGGAPLELNDLDADRLVCSIRWEDWREKIIKMAPVLQNLVNILDSTRRQEVEPNETNLSSKLL